MFMTPKKVLSTFMSVPIYSTSGVLCMAGLFFIVPGGIFILTSLLGCWVADRLIKMPFDDHIDTTIEEYENGVDIYYNGAHKFETNEEIWKDFFDEEGNDVEES